MVSWRRMDSVVLTVGRRVARTAVRWGITTPEFRMAARLAESLMAAVRFTRAALVGERLIRGDLLVEHRIPVALVAVAHRTSTPRLIREGTLAVDILRRPAAVAILVVEERPGLRRTTVVVASISLRGIAEASQG
jgi:hypothetical protein